MRKGLLILITTNIASKLIGLLREIGFATFYGVTAVMGAFRFSQTITLVTMNFFTSDTLNAGFLPLYERYKQQSTELAQSFFWYLFLLLSVFSLLVFSVLFFGVHWLVHWFAPGFHGSIVTQSEQFIRVFAMAVPFCLMGTLFSYLAMSGGSYFGVSARPVFESVGLILGMLFSVYSHQPIYIAWGFVLSYLLFFSMVCMICFFKGQLRGVKAAIFFQNRKLLGSDFWKTIRPLLILPLFMQGKYVAEKFFASLMAVSVVAALDYARFIVQTGVNVLATPIGLLGLSAFSMLNGEKLTKQIELVVIVLLNLCLPITLFLVVNSQLVITILYGHGAFDDHAVKQASTILLGMSLAFFAEVISYVLLKILNAQLQNHRVMFYSILAISCNILFIALFFRSLGPISLGLGESIYAMMIFILCVRHFNLMRLLREMLIFLIPVSIIYCGLSFYLAKTFELTRYPALLLQLSGFAIYWGVILLLNTRTRKLIWNSKND